MVTADQFLVAFAAEWGAARQQVANKARPAEDLCIDCERNGKPSLNPNFTGFMMGEDGVLARVARRLREVDPAMLYRRELFRVDGAFVARTCLAPVYAILRGFMS